MSAHIIVQGAAGSGQSTAVFGLLAQLADVPDVLVVGSDINGLILRPWSARPGMACWCALGTRDPGAHIRVLERAVREMDNRIAAMPPGHDVITSPRTRPRCLS